MNREFCRGTGGGVTLHLDPVQVRRKKQDRQRKQGLTGSVVVVEERDLKADVKEEEGWAGGEANRNYDKKKKSSMESRNHNNAATFNNLCNSDSFFHLWNKQIPYGFFPLKYYITCQPLIGYKMSTCVEALSDCCQITVRSFPFTVWSRISWDGSLGTSFPIRRGSCSSGELSDSE